MKDKNKFIVLPLLVIVVIVFSCNQPKEKNKTVVAANNVTEPATTEPVTIKQSKPTEKNLLVGNWERTDAPYQIKILAVQDNGSLKAGYFNPQSINVGQAIWNNTGGILKVYVELRDENYPGSNYKLNYYAEKDALAGEYFQAVEGTTYNVAFKRIK
jgi:hypothetical protein